MNTPTLSETPLSILHRIIEKCEAVHEKNGQRDGLLNINLFDKSPIDPVFAPSKKVDLSKGWKPYAPAGIWG